MILAQIQAAAPSAVPVFITIGAPVLSMLATIVSWLYLSKKQTRDAAASEARRDEQFKRLDSDVQELKASHSKQDGNTQAQLKQLLDLVQAMRLDIVRLQERDSLAKELAAIRRGNTEG